MIRLKIALLLASLLLLQACASIMEGTTQTITVETTPAGAHCQFLRQGMTVASVITPGGAVVEKTKHDMSVECKKDGYQVTRANLESGIEGATWANIILGGGVGWAIDSASGADNEYPEYVNLTLLPEDGSQPGLQTTGQTAFGEPSQGGGERWVGQEAKDACGSKWAMDIELKGDDLIGRMWRDEVEYYVRGSVPETGVAKARAAKSAEYMSTSAPRFLAIYLSFKGDRATGKYGVDNYGTMECLSPLMLSRL